MVFELIRAMRGEANGARADRSLRADKSAGSQAGEERSVSAASG
jgi:hypothetical protein